jgi:hypothetical protein
MANLAQSVGRNISLQAMMEEAQTMHKSLTEKFEVSSAREKARRLYQDGIKLIAAEVRERPLIPDVVLPVADEIGKTLALDSIQLQYPLIRALSKAYRVFVELTWHQCWRQGKLAIRPGLIENIRSTTEAVAKPLSMTSFVDVHFEIACTVEATKCLKPTDSIWTKYLGHVATVAGAAASADVGNTFVGLKAFFTDVEKDWLASWYLDAYTWRWLTTEITTIQDFETVLSADDIRKCLDKGSNYTVCLTMIFINVMKNKEATKELKEMAFKGGKFSPGLLHLLSLERSGTAKDFLSHPKEVWKKIASEPDRFWRARCLAMQYIQRLATKDKYKSYQEESRRALLARFNALKSSSAKRYAEERDTLSRKLEQFKEEKSKLDLERDNLEDQIASLATATRGAAEDGALERAEKRLKEVDERHEALLEETGIIPKWLSNLTQMEDEEIKTLQLALSTLK